jgi:7-carboxy-7-deazaguanine synthase
MKINAQPMERKSEVSGETLDVHTVFHTIQGEGPFCGRAAVFVRLAGCNLQCPACDTDYTTGRATYNVKDLIPFIDSQWPAIAARPLVVITGGEPFRQNLYPLCHDLLRAGYTVQIETNGTLPPPNLAFVELCSTDFNDVNCVFVVCSPKTGKVNSYLAPIIAAYKYVVDADSVHDEDGLPILALGHTAYPHVARPPVGFTGPVYIQPCDRQDEAVNRRNREAVVILAMNAPDTFTVQLQTHKILNLA